MKSCLRKRTWRRVLVTPIGMSRDIKELPKEEIIVLCINIPSTRRYIALIQTLKCESQYLISRENPENTGCTWRTPIQSIVTAISLLLSRSCGSYTYILLDRTCIWATHKHLHAQVQTFPSEELTTPSSNRFAPIFAKSSNCTLIRISCYAEGLIFASREYQAEMWWDSLPSGELFHLAWPSSSTSTCC